MWQLPGCADSPAQACDRVTLPRDHSWLRQIPVRESLVTPLNWELLPYAPRALRPTRPTGTPLPCRAPAPALAATTLRSAACRSLSATRAWPPLPCLQASTRSGCRRSGWGAGIGASCVQLAPGSWTCMTFRFNTGALCNDLMAGRRLPWHPLGPERCPRNRAWTDPRWQRGAHPGLLTLPLTWPLPRLDWTLAVLAGSAGTATSWAGAATVCSAALAAAAATSSAGGAANGSSSSAAASSAAFTADAAGSAGAAAAWEPGGPSAAGAWIALGSSDAACCSGSESLSESKAKPEGSEVSGSELPAASCVSDRRLAPTEGPCAMVAAQAELNSNRGW